MGRRARWSIFGWKVDLDDDGGSTKWNLDDRGQTVAELRCDGVTARRIRAALNAVEPSPERFPCRRFCSSCVDENPNRGSPTGCSVCGHRACERGA